MTRVGTENELLSILPLTFLISEQLVTFAEMDVGSENSPDEVRNASAVIASIHSLCVSHTFSGMIDFNHFAVHGRPESPRGPVVFVDY